MSYNPPPQPPQGPQGPSGPPSNMPPPPPPGYGYGPGGTPAIPPQVNTVAILLFVGGGFGILAGLLSFALSGLGAFFTLVGVLLLVLGAAEIYVGVALRQLKEWARNAAIVLAGIGALFNLIFIFKGNVGSIIGLILDGVIIYLLMQKPVIDAFARSGR